MSSPTVKVKCHWPGASCRQPSSAIPWDGLLGCEHTAAVQMLELRVAPDTGQHDKGREQGGENQNGPFLLHGDASPW